MEQDTLNSVADSLSTATQSGSDFNLWMIIALFELAVIIMLLLTRLSTNSKRSEIRNRVLKEGGEIDFGNVINSSFNSEKLYKELLVKCHPDRFAPDENKMKIADELSARITQSKHNIKGLQELKLESMEKLNINF